MDAPAVWYVRTPDGFDIAYAVAGDGRPVVLLPAPLSHLAIEWSSATYGPLLLALSRRYRLIRLDDRGSGMSTRGLPDDFSGDDLLIDLESVLDAIGLQRVVLIGRIVTGNVAVKFASVHPDRVEAVVLIGSSPDYRASFAHSHLELARTHWEYVLQTLARHYFPRDDQTLAVQLARQCVERRDFIRRAEALTTFSTDEAARKLQVPAMIVASTGPASPDVSNRRLAAMIRGATLRIVGDGDEFLPGVLPEEEGEPRAVEALDTFLDSLTSPEPVTANLTRRELEVLRLVAAGHRNRQIAEELFISPNTVARHLSNIYDRTGSANRAEAVAYASRHRLI
jgi:DNA-binding NarL/FixJ family response regulator